MGQIISYLVVGLIIGILSRFFYPGAVSLNWMWTILLGVGGSIVGGYAAGFLGSKDGLFQPVGLIGSVLGGMLLIFLSRSFL